MNASPRLTNTLTAADVMNRDLAVVPQQMLVREAARLLYRVQVSAAPVADENGRCVGSLSPADIFRWIEAGCPDVVVGPIHACPYQVRGRLLNGDDGVICIQSDGRCPFQAVQPTTGGRHTEICMRQETESSPFGTSSCYMTTDVVTIRAQTPLLQLVRQILDACADSLIVVDEFHRPIGIVSATEVLSAVAKESPARLADSSPCTPAGEIENGLDHDGRNAVSPGR
jgi:CBS-domain-containing membrane protein